MGRRWLALSLALILLLSLTACGGFRRERERAEEDEEEEDETDPKTRDGEEEEERRPEKLRWAVYWYLCGSDLESGGGFATTDLVELLEVKLPEDVAVVIQTGGAKAWQNDTIDASLLQRWLYSSEGLELVDEVERANMGEARTLYEFLDFANSSYPAERVAVTFWNHGGGSVSGVAFDEVYGYDSLDLQEMYDAFDAVWPADTENPAVELVGFDACLMSTIDVAAAFQPFARYLVASEELEPGSGWLYSGWVGALARDPSMDGGRLGQVICDTYYDGCEEQGTHAQTTLAVTDLTKLDRLLEAYESFGQEMLMAAARDPGFFAELGRAASQCENYGGNTRDQGYTNMLDLGHLARQTAWMLPSAQEVGDALEECVVYHISGTYRREATGLSCYYSYNGDINDLRGYLSLGQGLAFKYLYYYELTGTLAEGGEEYLSALHVNRLAQRITLEDVDWDDHSLYLDWDGNATLNLGARASDILSSIRFSLYYIDAESDTMLLLGTDNDIDSDWESGVFRDNFRGVWGAIDDHMVYMELSFEGDHYNLYSVPILLNGEQYHLQVVYDFILRSWAIMGATQGLNDSGMASKDMRRLEAGDVITTIWKMAPFLREGGFEMYTVDEFTVTAGTRFHETDLFNGSYAMIFEMQDTAGNTAYSDLALFEYKDGEIETYV